MEKCKAASADSNHFPASFIDNHIFALQLKACMYSTYFSVGVHGVALLTLGTKHIILKGKKVMINTVPKPHSTETHLQQGIIDEMEQLDTDMNIFHVW